MNNQSPRFTFNSQDKQTILAIVIHGAIGIIITLISEVFLKFNYGNATPIITTALSLISLTLTQYFNGPSSSTLKIQQLESIITNLQMSQAANNQMAKDSQEPPPTL